MISSQDTQQRSEKIEASRIGGRQSLYYPGNDRKRKSRVREGKIKIGGLEPPIHDRACKAVSGLDIDLGDRQVSFDHVQGGVSEDPLEGVDIPAIA